MRIFVIVVVVAIVLSAAAAVSVGYLRAREGESSPWKKALVEKSFIPLPRGSVPRRPALDLIPSETVDKFTVPPPPADLPSLPPPEFSVGGQP